MLSVNYLFWIVGISALNFDLFAAAPLFSDNALLLSLTQALYEYAMPFLELFTLFYMLFNFIEGVATLNSFADTHIYLISILVPLVSYFVETGVNNVFWFVDKNYFLFLLMPAIYSVYNFAIVPYLWPS